MCLGFPGRVEKIDELTVDVDIAGTKRNVSKIFIAEELNIGDWVMVHAGFAMSKMDENEAKETLDFLLSVAEGEEAREEEYFNNLEKKNDHESSSHECGCNKDSGDKDNHTHKDSDGSHACNCGSGCGCSSKN